MAVGAYRGTEKSLDAQKRALLSAVAERGQAGQAAFEAQQQAAQAMRADAVRGVAKDMGVTAPPAALAGQLGRIAGGPGRVYAGEAATQQAAFNSGIQGISAANSAYMDQAKAARPIAETVTERHVAQIQAELEAKKAQMAHDKEMAELEKQAALDAHRYAGEEHAWNMGELRRGSAAKQAGDLTPASRQSIEAQTGLTLDQQMAIEQNPSYLSLAETMRQAHEAGYSATQTQAIMNREAARLAKERGVAGYGRTLAYLWSMAGETNWGAPGKFIAGSYGQGASARPDAGGRRPGGYRPGEAPIPKATTARGRAESGHPDYSEFFPRDPQGYRDKRDGWRYVIRGAGGDYLSKRPDGKGPRKPAPRRRG